MKSLIRSILKEIWQRKINRKNNLLKKLAREIKKITLLDIGSSGDIEPRWLPIAETLNYIGVEPDERTSCFLTNIHNCKNYRIINSVIWSEKKTNIF